jgi:NCAIR mutase (PurE)-related protein
VPTPEPKAAAGKKVVVATEWPTAKFKVGDIVITSAGTALDLDQADKVRTAAKSAGVKLKEGEVK